MTTAIIEVAATYPPSEGRKQARVKTAANEYFYCWPDKLGLLRPGFSYEIEFSEREFDGRKFRTITGKPKEKPASTEASRPNPTPAPVSGALTSEQEFVSRLLAASIQACALTYSEPGLIAAAKMMRKVFREAMG